MSPDFLSFAITVFTSSGVVPGQLDHGLGDALAVEADQHRQAQAARSSAGTPTRVNRVGCGLNSAATNGLCTADSRARPEPPSSTPTGRVSLVAWIANMTFSFSK
jgi:hypothetical protein